MGRGRKVDEKDDGSVRSPTDLARLLGGHLGDPHSFAVVSPETASRVGKAIEGLHAQLARAVAGTRGKRRRLGVIARIAASADGADSMPDADQVWAQLDPAWKDWIGKWQATVDKVANEIESEDEDDDSEEASGSSVSGDGESSVPSWDGGEDEDSLDGGDGLDGSGSDFGSEGHDDFDDLDGEDDEELESGDGDGNGKKGGKSKGKQKKGKDLFFNEDDLENFLLDAERQEELERDGGGPGPGDEDSDDSEDDSEDDSDGASGDSADSADGDGSDAGPRGGSDDGEGSDGEGSASESSDSGIDFAGIAAGTARAKAQAARIEAKLNAKMPKKKRGPRYDEFFDPPASDKRGGAGGDSDDEKNPKKNRKADADADVDEQFAQLRSLNAAEAMDEGDGAGGKSRGGALKRSKGGDSDGDGGDSDSESGGSAAREISKLAAELGRRKGETTSAHRERVRSIRSKIAKLEAENMAEKSWQLRGEVSAKERPKDSLLEAHLDFEHATRVAPVITEETTKTLEEMIIARIKDNLFDDVERRVEPKANIIRKDDVQLDMEKSSKGLGEVYEDQYRKEVLGVKPASADGDELAKSIDDTLARLFGQLDALSNLTYRPAVPTIDMTVAPQAKAISLEEALPVGVSKADTLAPEQVHRSLRSWELVGKDEMTQEERKAGRRAKKAKHASKAERKEREKQERLGRGGTESRKEIADSRDATAKAIKSGALGRGVVSGEKADEGLDYGKSAQVFNLLEGDKGREEKRGTKRKVSEGLEKKGGAAAFKL